MPADQSKRPFPDARALAVEERQLPDGDVVQDLPFLGYTNARRQPIGGGRIGVGRLFDAGGGRPLRVRLAGAEQVPTPEG